MKLLNEGVNLYEANQVGMSDDNSIHPCYTPPCTVNLCGTCPDPIRYIAACL